MTGGLALLLVLAGAVAAQDSDPAWQRLGSVKEGAALRVHLRNRHVVSGRFVRSSPADLALRQSTIPKPEITKVSRRSRLRGALIGFAVGFAIAAPIGATQGRI
jgi:hypothetical protein